MKYDLVILDLDNTLIDFDWMEVKALKEALEAFGVKHHSEMIEDYIAINNGLWADLEKGKYSKAAILTKRFDKLFEKYAIDAPSDEVNTYYLKSMKNHVMPFEGAMSLLEMLKDQTKVVCLTNGVKIAQEAKFEKAGFYPYFDQVIISDVVGIHKPDVRLFEYMADQVGMYEKSRMIIVGDSLTSDIKGGNNFGIQTVWFNPKEKSNEIGVHVDYEIKHLSELEGILI